MKKLLFASVVALAAAAAVYQFAPGNVENAATSVSTDVSKPANVEAPHTVNSTTTSTFAKRAEEVQASLPTLDKIKTLSAEEVHSTPVAVLEAGLKLGELAETIEKDPTLAPEGIAFYGKCARRSDISSSIRALCLSDLRELSKKQGLTADESGIPAEIARKTDVLKKGSR
ncbi:MAG: hypothetical protein ACXVB9_15440 [Bdellovibrionota bacterium]